MAYQISLSLVSQYMPNTTTKTVGQSLKVLSCCTLLFAIHQAIYHSCCALWTGILCFIHRDMPMQEYTVVHIVVVGACCNVRRLTVCPSRIMSSQWFVQVQQEAKSMVYSVLVWCVILWHVVAMCPKDHKYHTDSTSPSTEMCGASAGTVWACRFHQVPVQCTGPHGQYSICGAQ